MMHRICMWLADMLALRVIAFECLPYLLRYYLCGKAPLHYWPTGTKPHLHWLPFSVYLHGFVRPDRDRDLHNHPWDKSYSLILSGGYDEERLDGRVKGSDFIIKRTVRPGRINVIRKDDFHRVTKLHADIVWTLFVTGRKLDTWGFRNRDTGEFLPWREHEKLRQQQEERSRA